MKFLKELYDLSEAKFKSELANLEKEGQAVWAEKDVDGKKAKLKIMIGKFRAKEKQSKLLSQIDRMDNANKLDSFAANLIHAGKGDQVVR